MLNWHDKEYDSDDEPRELLAYSRSQRRELLAHLRSHPLMKDPPPPTPDDRDSDSDADSDDTYGEFHDSMRRVFTLLDDPTGPLWLCYRTEMAYSSYLEWTPNFVAKLTQVSSPGPRRVMLDLRNSYLANDGLELITKAVEANAWLRTNVIKVFLAHNKISRDGLPTFVRLLNACPKVEYANLAINNLGYADFEGVVPSEQRALVHFSVF